MPDPRTDLLDQLHDYGSALESCVTTVTADDLISGAAGVRTDEHRRRTSSRMWLVTAAASVVVVVVIGSVLVAGNRERYGATDDDRALRAALVGKRFVVQSITEDGRPKQLVGPAIDGEPAIGRISFDDARVTSNGGCNSSTSEFDVVDGRLVLSGQVLQTAVGCQEAMNDQDAWLHGIVSSSPTVALMGDRLTVTAGTTTVVLVERDAPPDPPAPTTTVVTQADLTGRTFVATAALVDGVERRIVGRAADPQPATLQLRFAAEPGRVSVGATCNSGTGPYALLLGRIEGLGITTEAGCEPELVEQDEWLNAFFATQPTIALDGDYLTLGDGVGTVIVFVDDAASSPAVASPGLFGTHWSLDVRELLGLPPEFKGQLVEAYLILSESEPPTIYARDGCNVVTGDVRIDADSATTGSLSMGPLVTTYATCATDTDPVVEAMASVLDGESTYVLDGPTLRITTGDRTVVFTER